MSNQPDDAAKHRAIEFLAGEAKLPFDLVARIYERERAVLELGATVKKYLPILTFRKVQEEVLLHRPA